jgi:hypothetical protein
MIYCVSNSKKLKGNTLFANIANRYVVRSLTCSSRLVFRWCSVPISATTQAVLTEGVLVFPHPRQENSGKVLELRQDRPFPNRDYYCGI